VLSVIGGWVGLGGRFEHFLDPVVVHGEAHVEAVSSALTEYGLMFASVAIALAGIGLAWQMYLKDTSLPDRVAKSWRRLYQIVLHKYYVDEIYDAMFVNRAKDLGTTLGAFDANVIDGLGVNGAAWLTRFISGVSIWWDTWIVDGSVRLGSRLVWLLSYPVRMVQTGLVQSYMFLIVLGLVGFLGYYYFHFFKH
jgi:NADH-quinone oxidoreductase subunit L